MHVMVLGAGVVGIACADALADAGFDVTVVDRQPGPGLETSFANAGEVSPGYASPWAGPGVPLKALRWLAMRHRPLVIRPRLDPALWRFGAMLLANCTARRYAVNKARMVRLAEYSRDCLREVRERTGIRYDERMQGTLQLFRTQRQVDASTVDVAVLARSGVAYEVLDRAGCVAAEPALARVAGRIAGGLRLPGDETGDCLMFTQALAARCAARGVRFRYRTRIERLVAEGGRVAGVRVAGSPEALRADAYLLAFGSHTPLLAKPLGIDLPVYPVKGYSITVPIVDDVAAPVSTVLDESFKVAVTRLGSRIRVGGTAELAGYDLRLHAGRRRALEHVVRDLFPDGGDLARATFWCGLRPMTPDGPPLLGPTRYPNLHLATGHGTLGWTMAAGTGRVVADLLAGRAPEIDLEGLTLARFATR